MKTKLYTALCLTFLMNACVSDKVLVNEERTTDIDLNKQGPSKEIQIQILRLRNKNPRAAPDHLEILVFPPGYMPAPLMKELKRDTSGIDIKELNADTLDKKSTTIPTRIPTTYLPL